MSGRDLRNFITQYRSNEQGNIVFSILDIYIFD